MGFKKNKTGTPKDTKRIVLRRNTIKMFIWRKVMEDKRRLMIDDICSSKGDFPLKLFWTRRRDQRPGHEQYLRDDGVCAQRDHFV